MNVSRIVIGLVDEFNMPPAKINQGLCDMFAMRLQELLGTDAVEHVDDDLGHYWVEFLGKYYDAEHPEGVPPNEWS